MRTVLALAGLAATAALLTACSPAAQSDADEKAMRAETPAMAEQAAEKPMPVLDAQGNELDPELASGERSAEDRTAARSQMQFLLKSMRQLAEGDRAALLMRTGGLPYDEITRSLGISVNAAKVRVHRARKRLMGAQSAQETRS